MTVFSSSIYLSKSRKTTKVSLHILRSCPMNQQVRIAALISSLDPGRLDIAGTHLTHTHKQSRRTEISNQDQVIEELVSLANEHGLKADNLERLYEVLLGKKSCTYALYSPLTNPSQPHSTSCASSGLHCLESVECYRASRTYYKRPDTTDRLLSRRGSAQSLNFGGTSRVSFTEENTTTACRVL